MRDVSVSSGPLAVPSACVVVLLPSLLDSQRDARQVCQKVIEIFWTCAEINIMQAFSIFFHVRLLCPLSIDQHTHHHHHRHTHTYTRHTPHTTQNTEHTHSQTRTSTERQTARHRHRQPDSQTARHTTSVQRLHTTTQHTHTHTPPSTQSPHLTGFPAQTIHP